MSETPKLCCNCRLWKPDDEQDLERGKCTAQGRKVTSYADSCHRWRSNTPSFDAASNGGNE